MTRNSRVIMTIMFAVAALATNSMALPDAVSLSESCQNPAHGTGVSGTSEGGVWTTGTQTIGTAATSHYWATGEVEAGQSMSLIFSQSGFGAEAFLGSLHIQDAEGCVLVESLDWDPTNAVVFDQPGQYVVEVRSPDAHGGSYQLTAAITPGIG